MAERLKVSELYNSTVFRYLFTGGGSFVLETALLWFLVQTLSLNNTVSVAISFWFGLLSSFLLQKFFTFKSTSRHKKTLARETILYAVLVLFNYIFTLIFITYITPLIGNLYITRAVALGVTICWNFFIYKHLIFRTNNSA